MEANKHWKVFLKGEGVGENRTELDRSMSMSSGGMKFYPEVENISRHIIDDGRVTDISMDEHKITLLGKTATRNDQILYVIARESFLYAEIVDNAAE